MTVSASLGALVPCPSAVGAGVEAPLRKAEPTHDVEERSWSARLPAGRWHRALPAADGAEGPGAQSLASPVNPVHTGDPGAAVKRVHKEDVMESEEITAGIHRVNFSTKLSRRFISSCKVFRFENITQLFHL